MPTFFIQQFGCRATQADGAALERQLLDRGCTSVSTAAAADIVVVNTCTVTASADAEARDAIRKLHAANPAVRIIATGCYAQRAPEELAVLPGVSWVVGNSHKPQIPQLFDSLSAAAPAEHDKSASDFSPAAPAASAKSANDFVPAAAPVASANNFFPAAALHSDSIAPFHSFVGAQLYPERSRGNVAPHLGNILTGDIFEQRTLPSAPVLGGEGHHTSHTLKI